MRVQHVSHHLRAGHVHEALNIGLHALSHARGRVHEAVEGAAQRRSGHGRDGRHGQTGGGGTAQEQPGSAERRCGPPSPAKGVFGGKTAVFREFERDHAKRLGLFPPPSPPARRPPIGRERDPERDDQQGD